MSTHDLGLKPFGDQVVIEPEIIEQTASGILLPKEEGKPMQGYIRAIGPGSEKEEENNLLGALQIGMKVLFRQYAGTEFKHNDKKYLVLRASDIMCEILN